MAKEVDVQKVPVVTETDGANAEPQVLGELHIRVFDNGGIDLYVPETSKEFSPAEIEQLTQIVHKQLYEQRIAQMALDMFKSRLG